MTSKSDLALAKLTLRDIERFWAKVDRSGSCWVWTGARLPSGYGKFSIRGVVVTAHRTALTIRLGHPPAYQAIHSCDNPWCVNPMHLRDATQLENVADAMERTPGANVPPPHPRGKPHSAETRAKLSESMRGKHAGRALSPEWRAKISAAGRGRKHSPETKAKMAAAARGRKLSPETRKKISDARRRSK